MAAGAAVAVDEVAAEADEAAIAGIAETAATAGKQRVRV
jgi:hypothetical protein